MEKRRKLNVELIKFLIGSMLVVGGLMLLGSSLVNNRQYRKFYNDKKEHYEKNRNHRKQCSWTQCIGKLPKT